jgi:hypothetical protein
MGIFIITVAPLRRFLILVSTVLCCFIHRGRSVLLYLYLAPPVPAGVALTVVKRTLQSVLMSVSLGTELLPKRLSCARKSAVAASTRAGVVLLLTGMARGV